jgi:NTP pyrophosphatase (non-canonical NTP hydrolase)
MLIDKSLVLQAEQIADHYGLDSQMSVAQEELAELIQSISKLRRTEIEFRRGGVPLIHALMSVAEETADVLIMMVQLMHLLGNEDLVNFWMQQKLDRTRKRIQEELDEET